MEARGRPRKQGGASGGTGGTAARRRYACLLPPRRIARTTCRGGAPPGGAPFGTKKVCKFIHTEVGWLRGEYCAYLHPVEEDTPREKIVQKDITQLKESTVQDERDKKKLIKGVN